MPFNPARVEEARKESGLTQAALALAINAVNGGTITAQTVSAWERGEARPKDLNMDALVRVTGKDHGYFFTQKVGKLPTRQNAQKAAHNITR